MEAVFFFKFYQLHMFYRGSQDIQRGIRRLQGRRKRIIDAWVGTFQGDPAEHLDFLAALQAETAQLQADGLAQQHQAAMAGLQPAPIGRCTVEEGLERWDNESAPRAISFE